MRASFLIALLAVTACRQAEQVPAASDTSPVNGVPDTAPPDSARALDCGVPSGETPVLSDQGIGELRHNRTVTEIAASGCEIISDGEQRGQEGMMERAVVVRVAGEPVRTVVTNDRIFRIEVTTPRFRTADSLGVDTPLSRIAAMRGAVFAPGEDGVYGFAPDHCGLSFRFSLPWRPPAGGQWTAQHIAEAHGDAAVNRVIVIACTR